MIELSSTADAIAAIGHARTVAAEAYTLHGGVLWALEAAARHGAHVSVRLERAPFKSPSLAQENQRVINALRAAGADAALGHPLHAKAIEADGTLYLDDRNWGAGDLVVRENDPVQAARIPVRKSEALAEEAALLLDVRRDDAIVETESFSRYNAVSAALEKLARAGKAPRLLVSRRDLRHNDKERAALEKLAAQGVSVRVCDDSEKFALAGNRAWIGSANATVAFGDADMTDWGLCTDRAPIVEAVRSRIEARWSAGRPFSEITAAAEK